jgi:hypothetical protein
VSPISAVELADDGGLHGSIRNTPATLQLADVLNPVALVLLNGTAHAFIEAHSVFVGAWGLFAMTVEYTANGALHDTALGSSGTDTVVVTPTFVTAVIISTLYERLAGLSSVPGGHRYVCGPLYGGTPSVIRCCTGVMEPSEY